MVLKLFILSEIHFKANLFFPIMTPPNPPDHSPSGLSGKKLTLKLILGAQKHFQTMFYFFFHLGKWLGGSGPLIEIPFFFNRPSGKHHIVATTCNIWKQFTGHKLIICGVQTKTFAWQPQ